MRILTNELRFFTRIGSSGDSSLLLDFGISDPLAIMINAIQSDLTAELNQVANDNVFKRFQIDLDEDNTTLVITPGSRSSVLLERTVRSLVDGAGIMVAIAYGGPDWITWHGLAPESRPLTFRNMRVHEREETGSTTAAPSFTAMIHYQVVELTTPERINIIARNF